MSAGLSAAAIGGIAAGVGAIGGAIISSNGAQSAADTQANAANAGIQQQNYEFNTVQGLLKPYVDAGTGALPGYSAAQGNYAGALGQYSGVLGQLNNLTGANGATAQNAAIQGLTSTPYYANAMNLGQQQILANASATGGLRGGNTIASLGYLPGQVLSNTMQQQIGNLGTSINGISGLLGGYGNQISQYGNLLNLGENAAAGTGQAAQNTGNNITSLLGTGANAQAGATIATGNAVNSGINSLSSALGQYLNPSTSASNYQFTLPAYLNAAGAGSSSPAGLYGTGAGMF
jgi:hypothetical protein